MPTPGKLLRVGLKGRVALVTGGSQGLGRVIVQELDAHRINVNMLATGYIDNERSRRNVRELAKRQILNSCAIRHLIAPEEVAPLAAFPCSDAALYVTGTIMRLDAGGYI